MQWKVSMIVLTGLSVLFATGCSTTRSVRAESSEFRVESVAFRDSVKVESVEVQDSVTITKTITITVSEVGDTLRQDIVTDRLRSRTRDKAKDVEVRIVEKVDTVYIEREADKTVAVAGPGTLIDADGNINHQPSYITLLKWVFWIIVAIGGLIITITITKTIRR